MASFTIEKFGTLIVDPAGPKSGEYSIQCDKSIFCENSMTVYDSTEANAGYGGLGPNAGFSSTVYPDPKYLEGGKNDSGDILAEDINNGLYEYIDYDWSKSWDPAKVDYANRQFLYLRGPVNSEYVILFDRMNALNANHVKRTSFWMPFQPQAVDGSFTQTSAGHWSSNNTTIVSETNTYSGRNNHGRLFMKSLLPNNPIIERVGGPGNEFDDLNGSSLWKSSGSMTDDIADWFGSYHIQIRPSTQNNYDTFLNVMQIGDSNTLSTMTDIVKVESSDGRMVGSHIKDNNNQWIVMFAKLNNKINAAQYVLNGSGTIKHLIVNLEGNSSYQITDNGTVLFDKNSGSIGTLQFETVLSSSPHTIQVVKTGSGDLTPPAPPTNLKVLP